MEARMTGRTDKSVAAQARRDGLRAATDWPRRGPGDDRSKATATAPPPAAHASTSRRPRAAPSVAMSYARADKAHAERLAEELSAAGIAVWWDREVCAG